jgi:DNA mismatch repair protein MutS
VKETGQHVEYLHRVEPGRAEKSFGIHVAEIAGLPKPVIRRARTLLHEHESSNNHRPSSQQATTRPAQQCAWLVDALQALDLNSLSPVEALTKLFELQNKARGSQ